MPVVARWTLWDDVGKKVMVRRKEVRCEASKQFQLSGEDPTVSCDSSPGIWKIIGCNTIVNSESSRHGAQRQSSR